jgi:predicted metal-dependent TIM-barrel fold hydrolase
VWFDALLHAGGLGRRDLADVAFFGVGGALVPPDEPAAPATAAAMRAAWEAAASAARRLRRAGLRGHAACGLHPRAIPLRGLEALLADLPAALDRREVSALGAVGVDRGGELEERVLGRQLEVARELRLPVLAAVPARGRERNLRRLLPLLAEAEVEPGRVLVPADARTVRAVRSRGHLALLALSPGAGSRDPVEAAVRIVRSLGPEGIVLGSDAGRAGGDLLAVPRAADRLARAGLSEAVIRRVCGQNALAWIGER